MITLGIALPHYDGLFPNDAIRGADRTRSALHYAQCADAAGLHEVWVSDHLWLDLAPRDRRCSADCWALLSSIAATTKRVRVGSLVTSASLRNPLLLTHQIATVADIADGRLDIGLGAGWNELEFAEAGEVFPKTSDRLAAVMKLASMLRASLGSSCPPIWVGGKRTGILSVAAQIADGWNLAWDPTPAAYVRRSDMLQRRIAQAEDQRALVRSVGLTTVIGNDEADLRHRWDRLRAWVPGGHLDRTSFDEWRSRGLIGTPEEVHTRLAAWSDLGVTHIVCALGMPFGLFEEEQLDLLAGLVQTASTVVPAEGLSS